MGLVGEKTSAFCKDVFNTSVIPLGKNQTLLCLIPKTYNASMLKNLQPIGLCNTNYKLVTKIIVNRIKPHH